MPNVRHAGFWRRLAAYIIDTIILWAVLSIFGFLFNVPLMSSTTGTPTASELSFSALAVIVSWLYFALMESSKKQGTLGKMALRLLVTDENGRQISFGRATGRYFAKIISGIILMIGYLMAGWTKKKQALHDIIAKTLVIRD